jgi:hypothetical protein
MKDRDLEACADHDALCFYANTGTRHWHYVDQGSRSMLDQRSIRQLASNSS